ncbi:MAG: hypothetical protein M1491_04695 [Deltaproteobacteria bacterium]|nr:hypothetical protein [Deltaproteobacteria bacterium]MCL5276163.1 hypothetical protein [Deltaproteobacteria bacterium]
MRGFRLVPALLIPFFVFGTAAQAATLRQARRVFYEYDRDISNLQKAIDIYTLVIKENNGPDVLSDAYTGISMAYLTMGDFAGLTHTNALKDYEAGRDAALKAIRLNPDNSDGCFWYAGNIGRIAQRKDFIKALLMLPEFLEYLNEAYRLNPHSLFVLEAYAELYYQLPGAFGGSNEKSIGYIKKALKIDPHYTMPLTTLAKVYISEGRYGMARKILREVLDFSGPSYRAGWVMYDKPLAHKLMDSIKDEK